MQSLFKTRLAIVATFAIFGFLFSLWAVHIPLVLHHTGVSKTTLGLLLFFAGVGSWAGMQTGGHLVDRYGSRRITVLYTAWISAAMIPLALATDVWQLAIAMVLLGFGGGSLDIAMNMQAANLEEMYDRPIMSSFHAFFSIGSFAGAGIGALALRADIPIVTTFSLACAFGLGVAMLCWPFLLRQSSTPVDHEVVNHADTKKLPREIFLRVLLLGSIAFLLMLAEGVANDWSALQLKQSLDVTNAQAALGLTAFSVMMTIGRLSADTFTHRFGPVAVVRYGSFIASAGMIVVILSPTYWLSVAGWALFGLGLSGCVPQLFTAAGRLWTRRQGYIMSRVVGIGYIGLLAGPAVIGAMSHYMTLSTAMILPFIFTIVSGLTAKKVLQG